MEDSCDQPDLLTLTQLRQVAGPSPQPYRVHVQVDQRSEKQTSGGAPFLEIKLADAGESMVWRLFDNNPLFTEVRALQRSQFIELTAQWIDTGKYGIEPRQPQMRFLNEEEKLLVLGGDPDLASRQQADFADITSFVESIHDPRLRCLSSLFLEKHGERFRRTAAARENHHARRGGLVEHVAQMMRCAVAVSGVYPALNQDLLIAGVLFHDCGKLWENVYPENSFAMPYQLHGEMLGHITLGLELVNKLWRDMHDRPPAGIDLIEGGRPILRGAAKPDTLGVDAPDPRTVRVTLANPAPYFPSIAASAVLALGSTPSTGTPAATKYCSI